VCLLPPPRLGEGDSHPPLRSGRVHRRSAGVRRSVPASPRCWRPAAWWADRDSAPTRADHRRRRARSGPYRARPAGRWRVAWPPSQSVRSLRLLSFSLISEAKHHLLGGKSGDGKAADRLQVVVAAMIDEILRSEDSAAQTAGQFLKPRRQIYRRADSSEI